jgi:CxxC motif-containing protein (DUF1111 family)
MRLAARVRSRVTLVNTRHGKSTIARYVGAVVAMWAILIPTWILAQRQQASLTATARGAELFRMKFTPAQGLGPLFNARSCSGCHGFPTAGGVGRNGLATELRVGRLTRGEFEAMIGPSGPFARAHSVSELGFACDLAPGIPAGDNVSSVRNAPPLFGDGLINAIPDRVILARAALEKHQGMVGKPNLIRGPNGQRQIGRFGWKADVPTLSDFVGLALRNELGVTNPVAPKDFISPRSKPCPGESARPNVSEAAVAALTAFTASLPAPQPRGSQSAGAEIFTQTGCAVCHVPTLRASGLQVHLYSDLLLHNMGPGLDDHIVEASAGGSDWRTAPLWGLYNRTRYLHDGRATTLRAAILAHGGQAAEARQQFLALAPQEQRLLLAFLQTL